MPNKPINPHALCAVLIGKFVEMGLLDEKKLKGKKNYFLTEQGRLVLANFGIDENELYAKRPPPK